MARMDDNGCHKKCFKMMNLCTFMDLKAIIDILSKFTFQGSGNAKIMQLKI